MTIELKFTAESHGDLIASIVDFLGGHRIFLERTSLPEPEPEPVKVKAPRKAKANGVRMHPEPEVSLVQPEEEPAEETPLPPKAALELKEKVIGLLNEAFRNGKADQVRNVLATYGNGAKSFREIGIETFPAIEAAIQKGALS